VWPRMTGPAELETAIDALYAGDPNGFTAARKRLAADLRTAGRRDDARAVASLRRPTRAAWAIDHLLLQEPGRLDGIVAAGKRLRRAHEEVAAGHDRGLVHRAADARRACIGALAADAVALLEERGVAGAGGHREEIEATLEAASTDAAVAALARRGRLVTAVPRPAGFAALLDLALSPTTTSAREVPPPEERRRDDLARQRRRREAARLADHAREASARADEAAAAAEAAHEAVDRLVHELAAARAQAAIAAEVAVETRARADAAAGEAAGNFYGGVDSDDGRS